MDLRFSPEQEALRREVREFLRYELPPETANSWGHEWADDETWENGLAFSRRLAGRGWLTAHWPKEYGGAGMSIMEQVVLREELAYARAPVVSGNGVNMLGPILMRYGTEAQKRRHLAPIASCDIVWCQGYSEPNSGSDLASLQTRAVRDGDDYVVNGAKIWTGTAHRASWMFLLARTDPAAPKHKGISFLLLDLKTPGVTVRPLYSMAGYRSFNEESFEDVRIPAENLVGEENQGWYIGAALLDFERSNIGSAASTRRTLEDTIRALGDRPRDNNGERHALRHRLADLAIGSEVGRFLSYRIASIQERGEIPNYEASIGKLYHSELSQRVAAAAMTALGMESQMRTGPAAAFSLHYMNTTTGTIAGGTSEVQRNIVATRGLGLPRG